VIEVEMEVGDQTHGWAYLMVYDYDSACHAEISINGKPLMDIILSPGWNNIGWIYLPEGENRIDVIAKEGFLGSGTIITSITGGVDDQEIIIDFYIPYAYIWLYVANNEEEGLHFDLLLDGEIYDRGYVEGDTVWAYGYMETIAGTHTITVKWNGGSRSETVTLGEYQEVEIELEMGEFTWESICLHFLSKDRNFQYLTLFIDDKYEYETTLFYADYNQYYWTWLPSGIHTVTMEVWDGSISDFRYIERTLIVKEGDTEDKWFYLEPGEGKIEIPYISPSMTRADDDPLSVHIDGLEEGEVIGGEFTISGTAIASESNISAVYMRFDKDEWRELDGKDSWTYSFNTLALDDSYHTVDVMVADDEGRTSVDTGYFRVSNGQEGLDPVVHINSHANNQSVQTDVIISGTASAGGANGTISSVEYRIDGGSWMKADGTKKWQFEPFADQIVSGSHLLEVRSCDGQTFSTVVSIRLRIDEVNDPEHEINITSPEMNENATGNLVVTGDVDLKGEDGELKVQLSIDGGKWFDITSGTFWEYIIPSGSLSTGRHRVDARATLDGISSPIDSVTIMYDPGTVTKSSTMDIITPWDSSSVSGTVVIDGRATNVATSAHLEARIDDGNWIDLGPVGDHTRNGSPSSGDVEWSFSWNTTFRQWDEVIDAGLPGVRGGFHTISVKLTGEGQSSSLVMVSVNITSEEYLIDGITSPLVTKDLPRIISMEPEECSSGVYANQDIKLFFNTRMVPLDDVFVLRGPEGTSRGLMLEWGELNMSVRVIPSLDMDPGRYELIMKDGLRSLSGIPVTGNRSFTFSVSGGIAPGTFSISSVYPDREETDIPVDVVIEITFTDFLDPATISGSITLKDEDGLVVSFDHKLSDTGDVLELKTKTLEYETNYTVSISESLSSIGGLSMSRSYSWTFRTEKKDENGEGDDNRTPSLKTGMLACGAIIILFIVILTLVVIARRKNADIEEPKVFISDEE
jgi:hypothetical protein